jgi:hypothetical protein
MLPPSPHRCPCRLDGLHGDYCNITGLHTCLNQCSGRGHCYLGLCVCQEGWYGIDCSLRAQNVPYTKGRHCAHPAAECCIA